MMLVHRMWKFDERKMMGNLGAESSAMASCMCVCDISATLFSFASKSTGRYIVEAVY